MNNLIEQLEKVSALIKEIEYDIPYEQFHTFDAQTILTKVITTLKNEKRIIDGLNDK